MFARVVFLLSFIRLLFMLLQCSKSVQHEYTLSSVKRMKVNTNDYVCLINNK